MEREDKTELVFYFIKDYIEPLIREILSKAYKIFVDNSSITNYKELNCQIEKFIMQKIICGFEIEN